ncbi:MAG: GIY-YIG nuclease family protein [Patescibacteria group bacterium]
MHYVYILYSQKLNKFYVGRTDDLKRRLGEHNSGSTPFTASGTPWKLVFYEAFMCGGDAVQEELFLKTGQGRERRNYLLKEFNSTWRGV